jgi:hypothetical protein
MGRKRSAKSEAVWAKCSSPAEVMPVLLKLGSERKKRLFAAACVRRIEDMIPDEFMKPLARGVEGAERFADDKLTKAKLRQLRTQIGPAFDTELTEAEYFVGQALTLLLDTDPEEVLLAVELSADAIAGLAQDQRLPPTNPPRRMREHVAQVALLRDIFGNPFRPVAFDAAWRTSTAVALAKQMYESRDFGAMPILADALQDAGCDNDDILNHCRDTKQVHVRGCWVVDLVLGKA